MAPTILYSLVSRGQNVLAEWTEQGLQGNFSQITRVLLKKIDTTQDAKMSYVYDQYVFHYTVSGGLTFLCMCDHEFARLVAFRFLAKVESQFLTMFAGRWSTAKAYAFNADFKGVLDSLMREYSAIKDEKISKIQDQISEIKLTMTQNIEKVLDRGERIEILVDKSQQMEEHAIKFHKQSVKLKRKFCCLNAKWWIFIMIVVAALIYLILALACKGPGLPECT